MKVALTAQVSAVEVAERFFAGKQSGPRSGSKEGLYLAPQLAAAIETLRFLELNREEFLSLMKARGGSA